MTTFKRPKVITLFSLVMINIIAVDSLRSLPISATYGLSIFFLYGLMAVFFFIPCALVTAELATGWPNTGGIYVWVREAFGRRWGFFVIFMQWIYNIVWFPTIMAFIASTCLYYFNPALSENPYVIFAIVLTLFWITTIINCFGMKASSILSSIGAMIGTLMPMLLISILGIIWLIQGHALPTEFTQSPLIPDLSNVNSYAFLVAILFGLVGLEMSAAHAEEVKNPKRSYPLALLISVVLILMTLIFASLAIAIVVPKSELSIITGLVQAYKIFFSQFGLSWLTPIIVGCIVIGSLAGVGAWVIGPVKGMYASALDGCLPQGFNQLNRFGAPQKILLLQGLIFTILSLLFLIMPSVSSTYWILSDMTAQLALFVYLGLFASALRLRYKRPTTDRAFSVPGGKLGLWVACAVAILCCIGVMILGFFPPEQVDVGNVFIYESILIGGMIGFCALPFFVYRK